MIGLTLGTLGLGALVAMRAVDVEQAKSIEERMEQMHRDNSVEKTFLPTSKQGA